MYAVCRSCLSRVFLHEHEKRPPEGTQCMLCVCSDDVQGLSPATKLIQTRVPEAGGQGLGTALPPQPGGSGRPPGPTQRAGRPAAGEPPGALPPLSCHHRARGRQPAAAASRRGGTG